MSKFSLRRLLPAFLIAFCSLGFFAMLALAINPDPGSTGCFSCSTCGDKVEGAISFDSPGNSTGYSLELGNIYKPNSNCPMLGISCEYAALENCQSTGPGGIESVAMAELQGGIESMTLRSTTAGDVAKLAVLGNLRTSPSSYTAPSGSLSEVVKQNDVIRQVVTESALSDIQPIEGGGYTVTTWSRHDTPLGAKDAAGLRPVPISHFAARSTFSSTGNGHLQVVTEDEHGAAPQVTTVVISQDPQTNTKVTSTYDGNGTAGQLLRRETVTLSQTDPDKIWQCHVEQVIEEASVDGDGNPGALAEISHTYEEFIDITPEGKISTGENEDRWRRIARRVDGYGSAHPRETLFTYDLESNPTAVGISPYGRLKSERRADGSWTTISYVFTGNTYNEIKYSAYVSAPFGDTENARRTTTVVAPMQMTVNEVIGGVTVAKRETHTAIDNALTIVTQKVWDGSTWHVATSALHYGDTLPIEKVGRPAWSEQADGTATVFSYSLDAQSGDITTTTLSGAGDRSAVTAGSRSVSTTNQVNQTTSTITSDIASGLEIGRQVATELDLFGRPKKIVFNNNPSDYTLTTQAGCCGSEYERSRDGSVTEYKRDPLKRAFQTITTRSSGDTPVITKTTRNGLVSSTTITDGTTTFFVSSTTRALNGDTLSSTSADTDNNPATAQTTTYAYSYPGAAGHPAGEGVKTTTTAPDGATSIDHTYLDGRSKSTAGTAVSPTNYSYATHTENGGGESTTVSYPGTSQSVTSYADALGRTFKTDHGDGALSTATFYPTTAPAGSRGNPATSTEPDGVTTSQTYNAEGEVSTVTRPLPDSQQMVQTSSNDVITDPTIGIARRSRTYINGILTSTSLQSADGFRSKAITLAGTSTSERTLPNDGAWSETNTSPDGTTTVATYSDGLLKKSESKSADPQPTVIASTTFTHDSFGRTLTTTDSRTGTTTINGFTESGLSLSVTDPAGNTTALTYDVMGRTIATDAPDTQDSAGNPINNITYTSYHPTGEQKAIWGDQTNTRLNIYDAQNRLIELRTYQNLAHGTEPTAATTGFAATKWQYNPTRGWLDNKEYADNQGPSYTYTPAGQLKTRTWARGIITTHSYENGLRVATSYSDGITKPIAYSYNNFGHVTQIIQGSGGVEHKHTFTFDPTTLQLTEENIIYGHNGANGVILQRALTRSHDNFLRPTGYNLKNGTTDELSVSYAFDTGGRLTNVTSNNQAFNYNYLANSGGLIESVTGPVHTVTNSYEEHRNVLAQKTNSHPTTQAVVSQFSYTVNPINQRTALATAGTAFAAPFTRDFGYNPRGEVTKDDHSTNPLNDRAYQYDGIGNRQKSAEGIFDLTSPTAKSYTSNVLNQYTNISGTIRIHDADGNLLNEGTKKYTWDAENRLIEVKDATTDALLVANEYDYRSRRITKNSTGTITRWIYEGWNPIAEYNVGTGILPVLSQSYTWGTDLSGSMQGAGGVGGLLAVTDSTGSYYPSYDGNGNVSEYLNSQGVVVAHYEYDPFGKTTIATGTKANDFTHRFSTKPLDAETELYYYGYRYYSSQTGRWLSRDPIEERGGINLYGMVGNDPLNAIDALGQYAYTVYRPFRDGWSKYIYPVVGHVFLAFDHKFRSDSEKKIWDAFMKKFSDERDPKLITLSFHPLSVKGGRYKNDDLPDNAGNILGIVVTSGSYVWIDDPVDMTSFKSSGGFLASLFGRSTKKVITKDVCEQIKLFKVAFESAKKNINGTPDPGTYGLFDNNCGSWAKLMTERAGLKYPRSAKLTYNAGATYGGPADYTLLPKIITTSARTFVKIAGKLAEK